MILCNWIHNFVEALSSQNQSKIWIRILSSDPVFFTSPINSAILAVFAINNKFQSTLYLTIVHSIVVPKMAIKIEHKWKIDILTQIGQRENCFPALKEPAEFSLSSIPHLFVLQKKQHSIQKFWMEGGNDAATIYCIVCIHYIALGKVSWGKSAVLLDFVQITSPLPPIWKTCTTFFPTSKFKIW